MDWFIFLVQIKVDGKLLFPWVHGSSLIPSLVRGRTEGGDRAQDKRPERREKVQDILVSQGGEEWFSWMTVEIQGTWGPYTDVWVTSRIETGNGSDMINAYWVNRRGPSRNSLIFRN